MPASIISAVMTIAFLFLFFPIALHGFTWLRVEDLDHVALRILNIVLRREGRSAVRTLGVHSDDIDASAVIAGALINGIEITGHRVLVFSLFFGLVDCGYQRQNTADRRPEEHDRKRVELGCLFQARPHQLGSKVIESRS